MCLNSIKPFSLSSINYKISSWVIVLVLAISGVHAQTPTRSAPKDTSRNSRDARRKLYARWNDRLGNRLNYKNPRSPLFLKDPKNVNTDIKMTPEKSISVTEKLGDPKTTPLNYRNPTTMTYEQFQQLQNERVRNSLWRDYAAKQDGKGALGGRGLLPKLDLPPGLDRIFGNGISDIKPNGFVLLDFGIRHQRIDNPLTPVFQRKNTTFFFDQQININLNGKIGGNPAAAVNGINPGGLSILTNFDTKASFNFENQFKLNYKPEEQSLIQGIQAGNINWQLPTQLITGVQNLRGVKADLRFGRLNVSLLASQQVSKQQCITLRGGAQNRPFEIRGDAYEENSNFFLSQFFRDNYEKSLKNLPMITSGVTITRVEVYVTNRSNNTETLRNLAAFADLGEAKPYNASVPAMLPIVSNANSPVDNNNNGLFKALTRNSQVRQIDQTASAIANLGLQRGENYDILRGARRLRETEFRFHPQLGYITMLSPLRNDEVLAVAYEYTYNGRPFKVGELTEDYQSRREDEILVLKLLKASTSRNNTQNPMWNLMMKNVYSLKTPQIAKQGFQLRVIYKDDLTGLDNPNLQEGKNLQNVPLLRVMGLDKLNALGDPQPDGNFDFVEGTTIDSRFGKIIFPVLEPFGNSLAKKFDTDEDVLKNKYVFNELYRTTQIDAQQITEKNKFYLKGSYQGALGGGAVQLPFGVSPQSVTVKAAGAALQSGTDYIVDTQIGQVRIINESVANSGRDIEVCYEQPDLFVSQTRTTLGARLEYTASPDLKIGSTVMRLRETPTGYISRTAIGNEPVNNTMIGADITWRKESQFLTKVLDALPLLQTKEKSSIQFQGEVAKLYSGISPQAKDRSFVDDFEAARTPFDYTRQPNRWRLGATPQSFPEGRADSLRFGYKRARISAYTIDNTFYPNTSFGSFQRPTNFVESDFENYYEKFFLPQDIFTGRSARVVNLPEATLDIAYFPSERGIYNFNPDLDAKGRLTNPELNHGALTRAISSDPDFDNANIENIEFWMMDPFIDGPNGIVRDGVDNKQNTTGGKFLIQLGEISEDVMKNGRSDFENGLPIGDKKLGENVVQTAWGNTAKQQNIINAFGNQPEARPKQDVGLDGLSNDEEKAFFKTYIDQVGLKVTDPAAKAAIEADPAGDDFEYYFSAKADAANKKIIERYKYFGGMENNSPIGSTDNQLLIPASTILPDAEDLNIDNTINDLEQYYEYEIPLKPKDLAVGKGYIVDQVNARGANWYLFRIPVREFTNKFGGINGFKTLRFMRLVMTGWKQPVVLRFAQFQMVGMQYRKYIGDLNAKGLQEVPEPYDPQFVVSTVSAEENSSNTTGSEKYVYQSPPGFDRDRDFTQTNFVQLNEQSMSLCVTNLRDGDSKAAFKNVNINMLLRKRLKMFVHMHNDNNENGKVAAFLRLGTDVSENYYEIEVDSLQSTNKGNADAQSIWPAQNEIDIAFEDIINVKAQRDKQAQSLIAPFSRVIRDVFGRKYKITVVGRPDLSTIMMLMVGVRNPRSPDQQSKSFCIWVDELHTSGLETQSATAALGTLNLKLADFATIQATGRYSTYGFGGIQQKPADRSRDNNTELSVSANIALEKLLPQKWGFKIPLYVNYDNKTVRPHYNPLDPDMPLDLALSSLDSLHPEKRAQLENIAVERAIRKGFNFSNVRKTKTSPGAKRHFYDFENLSFTYAYNEFSRQNSMIADYSQRQYKGGIAYQYSFPQKTWAPFKNVKSFDRPYLELLKDFNLSLLPTMVSIRYEGDRNFTKTVFRNADLTTDGQIPIYEKFFLMNRRYDISWNLTKSVMLSYSSIKSSVVDEPPGEINTQIKSDSLWRNFWRSNRTKSFDQNIKLTYRIPFDKIPLLDWMVGDYTHNIRYQYSPTDQSILQDKSTLDHTVNNIGSQYIPNSYNLRDDRGELFGNTVRNTKEWGLIGKVDLVKLYNKIKYLNFANRPSQPRKNFARSPGDDEEIVRNPSQFAKNLTRFLMAVRGIDMSYTEIASTTLNGFLPQQTNAFGINSYEGLFNTNNQPMLPFIFGSQNSQFENLIINKNWVSRSMDLNQPFIQTLNKTFRANARLEPIKDFRITLDVRRTRGDEFRELYMYDTLSNGYSIQSPVRNGNFEISFISFKTAFEGLGSDNVSETYNKFRNVYRPAVLRALNNAKGNSEGQYNLNSQDVLIGAFFSAYNGRDSSKVNTNPFLNWPLPNWTVNYGGLANLAPFKKIFSSFTLEHSYQSTFSVGNFTSSLLYTNGQYLNLTVRDYRNATLYNDDKLMISPFLMSAVKITERMSPLIAIRARTKSKIDLGIRYDKNRTITLFLTNAYLEELYNKTITITAGFTKSGMRIPFKINGKYQKLKNDVSFKADFALMDTRSITRRLEEETPTISHGSYINYRMNALVDYTVSKLWSVQLYYNRTFNAPLVSTIFENPTSAGGIRVRFNVAEL